MTDYTGPPPIKVDTGVGVLETTHAELDLRAHQLLHAPEVSEATQGVANVLMSVLEERSLLYQLIARLVTTADASDPIHAYHDPTIRAARIQLGWPPDE